MDYEKLAEAIRAIVRQELKATSHEYLTVEEAAEYTRFTPGSVYNLVSERRIPYIKREGKVLFNKSSLSKWLQEREITPRGLPIQSHPTKIVVRT